MQKEKTMNIPKPSLLNLLSEGRAVLELGALGASMPFLAAAPKGDGHPVMVVPGFLATDFSTKPLRSFLKKRGYASYGWELGPNLGTHIVGGNKILSDELINRVIELSVIHDRKVSLVGWSLGGVLAREIARIIPDCVRQVITLGSPFNGSQGSSPAVKKVFELINGNVQTDAKAIEDMLAPPPVPSSALFSKTDGITHWQACINQQIDDTHQAENIEVYGSHTGLGHNPQVVWIIANRLAQAENQWRPYKATDRVKKAHSSNFKTI